MYYGTGGNQKIIMERKELVGPVLLGTALAILLNAKKDVVTILIEIISGVATAFYIAPYVMHYFNFPETIVAFGLGTASSKICLAIYQKFGEKSPILIIQENASVNESAEGLDQNK